MTVNLHNGPSVLLLAVILVLGLSGCREKPYDTSMYYLPKVEENTGAMSLIEHPYILEDLGLKLDKLSYNREGELVWIQAELSGEVEQYEGCELYVHAYPNVNDERFINLGGKLVLEDGKLYLSRKVATPPRSDFGEIRFGLGCQKQRKFSVSIRDVIIE